MNEPIMKYQAPRDTLNAMRGQYEAVQEVVDHERRFKEHRRKHPGRIEALMAESDKYLQQAEWVLGATNDRGGFSDKLHDLAFTNALKLAHKAMLLAVLDQPIMIGEKRSKVSKKGAEATNRPGPLDSFLKVLAKRRDYYGDYANPGDLWPELETMLDNMGWCPRVEGTGTKKTLFYEGDSDGYITYENFRKRIPALRDKT